MVIDLAQVQRWADQVQALPDGTVEQAAQALGLTGRLVARTSNVTTVEPLPRGVHELELVHDRHGLVRLDLELAEGFTREALDRALGPGVTGPRIGPDLPLQRRHLVSRPDRPNDCVLYAEFESEGDELPAGSVSTMLMLMRERRSS